MKVYFFFKVDVVLGVLELSVVKAVQLLLNESLGLGAINVFIDVFVHVSQSF